MPTTYFAKNPRRGDPNAAMVVNENLNTLRDLYDALKSSFKAGVATVLSGNTTLIVTHSLGNVAYRVSLTPSGADPTTRYWVSNKTSTQFQINLAVAAPAGGVSFDWLVKAD